MGFRNCNINNLSRQRTETRALLVVPTADTQTSPHFSTHSRAGKPQQMQAGRQDGAGWRRL